MGRGERAPLPPLPDDPPGRDVGNLLLGAHAMVALVLVILLLGLPRLLADDGPEEAGPSRFASLSALDVEHASDRLSDEVRIRQRRLNKALLRGDEANLVTLLRLQAEAAQLELGEIRFAPGPRQGLIQPVQASMEVRGGYYDLPIFVDGLFRQSRVVEIGRISVESSGPFSARIIAHVEARYFRPVAVPARAFTSVLEGTDLDAGKRGFAASALNCAAQLEAIDAFEKGISEMETRSARNRQSVLRALPSLVRQLPGSPMGWVAAEFGGAEPRILTEPEL